MSDDTRSVGARTLSHYERRAAEFWEGTRTHDVTQNYAALLSAIEGTPPFRILDLGCGPGRDLAWFRQAGHHVVGVDGSSRFVTMARAHAGVEVLEQDMLALSLGDRRFDGVFANASLFHVPTADLPRLLAELHRALVPRGVFFASNPRGNDEEGWNGDRYACYRELPGWQRLIEPAGFDLVHHYYRPEGLPRTEQPWLATVFRRREIDGAPLRSRALRATTRLVKPSRVSIAAVSLVLASLVFAGGTVLARAAGPEAMVWLKTGGFVRGELVELTPQDHVTVLLATGEVRKIPWAEVDHTTTDMSPAASQSSSVRPPPLAAPSISTSSTPVPAGSAVVRVLASRPVSVESRPRLDRRAPWVPVCEAPCDRPIRVESLELRIAGAGVTPSNAFVVQSSQSQIPLDVAPGRSDLRSLGILGLVIGSPVAVLGGVGIGVGVGTDVKGHETMQTVGIITAIVGGVLTLAALPLLALGSTSVRTAKGETIARALTGRLSF